jgi:N-acetylglutamate synthase-like GNAT family acetyltransferase
MATVCRSAKITDLEDINVLFQSATREGHAFSNRQEIVFKRILDETLIDLIVVEKDEYVVGCCHCAIIPTLAHGGRSFAVMNHFLIDPLNRKQGLARQLLQHTVDLARKKGCYQILVSVDSVKPWHNQFLTQFGFKQHGGMFVFG